MRKNFPLLLLSCILFTISCEPEEGEGNEPRAEEEIIEIPDEHFRHALLNTNSIDTNGDKIGDSDIDLNNDGKIQRSEAELIEGLILVFRDGVTNNVDLTGIENFVNLKYLAIAGNGFPTADAQSESKSLSYDFSNLKKLQILEFNHTVTNFINEVKLSGLSNLSQVTMINNRPKLEEGFTEEDFALPENFMDVNLEGTTSLTSMDITNSFLNIDFCQVPSLKRLNMFYLEGGEPEVFDFHCLTELEWLNIGENYIKSLVLKNSSVLETLLIENIGSYGEHWNYPFVEYICIDDIPEEHEQIATLIDENTLVVTDCTF